MLGPVGEKRGRQAGHVALSVALSICSCYATLECSWGTEELGWGAPIFCGLLRPQHRWWAQGQLGVCTVAWDDGSVGRREAGDSMETASEPGPKGDDRKAHLDLKPELFSSGMGGLWRE